MPLCVAGDSWRSALYPEDWTPGFSDQAGRFLHDFSYAGYHRGEKALPARAGSPAELINVTSAPYGADPSGQKDSTAGIQAALDAAAQRGGGAVYLPAGTYWIAPPAGQSAALRVEGDNILLFGDGPDKTFLINTDPVMRQKAVIEIKAKDSAWWHSEGTAAGSSPLSRDLSGGSLVAPVEDASRFAPGDLVVVRNDLTERFIESLGMTGKWTRENMKGRAFTFCRRIAAVDAQAGTVTLDAPTRYELKKEDNARVVKLSNRMISEVGLEDFSVGMVQHPDPRPASTWGETDYSVEGTPAYDVHLSHAIRFISAENCWMRRVNSFSPPGNTSGVHVLSDGVELSRSRFITVEDCDWRHPQYRGGGGNGYLYILHGSECLLRRCHAEGGRHNYDIGTMAATGNVILDCLAKDGRLPSDFHMYFSVANLFDNVTCDGDYLEARYRPHGGAAEHGVTTSQSVFWNTNGLRYIASPFEFDGKMRERRQVLVESEQFGDGYVIGTRGPASKVKTTNFVEGVGRGDTLVPRSLYVDQLERRLKTRGGP